MSQVIGFALALAEATGVGVRLERRPDDRYRVEAVLPQEMDGEGQLAVLAVLERADTFGHHFRPEEQSVWGEFPRDAVDGRLAALLVGSDTWSVDGFAADHRLVVVSAVTKRRRRVRSWLGR
ncbi:hypothetical protein GCM10009760_03860 [Kitasatospora kazusensis]|uniref:Uncharacterized protein n=1 Tax=Kitasatospora kazusensis TaxID=407974 RepID=A0ABP5KD82_9ACTN